ncbi:MAG TPA: hypothetical protein VK854_06615 [Woeseiaceae bacterium]|nr:hypothetical protein [Woeseiaceae bacterium]
MKTDRRITAAVAIAAFVLVSTEGIAQDAGADVRFSTGVEYSTGKYGGTDDIEEIYVPFTFRVGLDRVGFRLTAPYLSVTAPEETVITDPGTQPLPGSGATVTESGPGDVVGAVTLYDLYVSDTAGFVIDVTGKIKFATADETKGLGTGENDYTLQFDAYRFFDRLSLQGTAGYRLRGDPPGFELNDVFLASVGGAWLASDNTMLGMYFDYRESSLSGVDDLQELSGFASFRLNSAWRMEIYAFTGLTDSSTDFGGGILFSTDLSQLRVSDRQDY